MFIVVPLISYLRSRKQYEQSVYLSNKHSYNINSNGVELRTSDATKMITWNKVIKVLSIPKWYVIYTDKFTAHIIPKRDISNGQMMELSKYFSQKTKMIKSLF